MPVALGHLSSSILRGNVSWFFGREVVLKAVTESGGALEYASEVGRRVKVSLLLCAKVTEAVFVMGACEIGMR